MKGTSVLVVEGVRHFRQLTGRHCLGFLSKLALKVDGEAPIHVLFYDIIDGNGACFFLH